jgi:hypothetical protein
MVLLLVAGFIVWQHRPVPATVHLNLTGTPGLKVAGTVVVDGVPRQFTGVLPTTITVEALTFDYSIQMQEPQGELRGEVTVDGGLSGSSSTANDFGGVKGHYAHTWRARGIGMTTTTRKGE